MGNEFIIKNNFDTLSVLCRVCSDASDTQRIWWDCDTVEREANYEPIEFTPEEAEKYIDEQDVHWWRLFRVPVSFIYPEEK